MLADINIVLLSRRSRQACTHHQLFERITRGVATASPRPAIRTSAWMLPAGTTVQTGRTHAAGIVCFRARSGPSVRLPNRAKADVDALGSGSDRRRLDLQLDGHS